MDLLLNQSMYEENLGILIEKTDSYFKFIYYMYYILYIKLFIFCFYFTPNMLFLISDIFDFITELERIKQT